jgi:hypothetical protein
MAFATSILDDSVKKNFLVVIRPRQRVTGWTLVSANIYSAPFTLGRVNRAIISYPGNILEEAASSAVASGEFFYDSSAKIVYVYSNTDPDSFTYPGVTIEFDLYVSTQAFTGPKDPLNSTTQVVDWVPALVESPIAVNGSRDSIVGFTPLNQSGVKILNHDGWMNEILHDCSFNFSFVKAYIICGDDYDDAVRLSDISEVFVGYADGLSMVDETLTISVSDFFNLLNRQVDLNKYVSSTFSNTEPGANEPNAEWSIRKVYGWVRGLVPVNINYSQTAANNTNREWSTHQKDFPGVFSQAIDAGAANSATRTYFLSEPIFLEGDAITHNASDDFGFVVSVNRVSNYIDHSSLSRSINPGDTIQRKAVSRVYIRDRDGTTLGLSEDSDYTFSSGTNDFRITLVNNFEASYASLGGAFDPTRDQLFVEVYGTNVLPVLSDGVTDLGALSNYGGVASKASTILYRILVDAGIDQDLIDEASFQSLDTDHSLGIQFPLGKDSDPPTYKDLIQQILKSMIWKLGFITTNNRVKIGIIEVKPFVSTGDYDLDDTEFSQISYEHDYADIYSRTIVRYAPKEFNDYYNQFLIFENFTRAASSSVGADLHFVPADTLNIDTNHYIGDEAQIIADRYSYVFGERRGIYQMQSTTKSVLEGNLGASIDLSRDSLPGFSFIYGTPRERQLQTIEVQKSTRGARLTLEDQKGIQDNSGDW